MKTTSTIAKILAAIVAVAGTVYVIATYGDKIVAWAKRLLKCSQPECECEECDCEECECEECECCECTEEATEETVEETTEAPVAEETDFVG